MRVLQKNKTNKGKWIIFDEWDEYCSIQTRIVEVWIVRSTWPLFAVILGASRVSFIIYHSRRRHKIVVALVPGLYGSQFTVAAGRETFVRSGTPMSRILRRFHVHLHVNYLFFLFFFQNSKTNRNDVWIIVQYNGNTDEANFIYRIKETIDTFIENSKMQKYTECT